MKLYQSLFLLKNSYDTITYLSEIMADYNLTQLDPNTPDEKRLYHFMTLFKHSILEACSFIEEYEQNFGPLTEPEFHERIRFVKTAAKPVMKKIKAWSDMQTIRNEMIAHPWRGKGNSFSYAKVFTYKSPRNYWELQVLRYCLLMIVGLIDAEFDHELSLVPVYMESIKPVAVPATQNLGVLEELKGIVEKVNVVCLANKKNYRLVSEKIIGS